MAFLLESLVFGLSAVIMPFFIIYFLDLGLSYFKIALLGSVYSFFIFLFEVPTGAFADGFSRKYSSIIGVFIGSFCALIIPLSSNYYYLLGVWALFGIGLTFLSGAKVAWVVDNLKYHDKENLVPEFFIKFTSIAGIGLVCSPIIGGLIVKYFSMNTLWTFYGCGLFVIGLILLIFTEEHYKPKKLTLLKTIKGTYNNSKKGFNFILKHRTILLLTLGGLFSALMMFGGGGWQPFFVELTLPTYALGYVYSLLGLLFIFLPFFSKLLMKYKVKNVLTLAVLLEAALLFALLFLYPPLFIFAIILFLTIQGIGPVLSPISASFFQKFIPTEIRATVSSVNSMIGSLIVAVATIMAGYLMDIFGPQRILAVGGIFGIFAALTYFKIKD